MVNVPIIGQIEICRMADFKTTGAISFGHAFTTSI